MFIVAFTLKILIKPIIVVVIKIIAIELIFRLNVIIFIIFTVVFKLINAFGEFITINQVHICFKDYFLLNYYFYCLVHNLNSNFILNWAIMSILSRLYLKLNDILNVIKITIIIEK